MNYPLSPTGMQQSDAIVRKLNQIHNAIQAGNSDHRNRVHSSAHQSASVNQNLNDYLPEQRLKSNPRNEPDSHSYRRSLEKRLQRMFKQERTSFVENYSFMGNNPSRYDEPERRFIGSQNLTVDRMEMKIRELQRKYLGDKLQEPSREPRKTKKKSVSMVEKQPPTEGKQKKLKKIESCQDSCSKPKLRQQKIERKLLRELQALKVEVQQLKRDNQDLAQKITSKSQTKRSRKQRSKYLLNCIIEKLQIIQRQVSKRNQEGRYHKATHEDRILSINEENEILTKEVEELGRKLKRLSQEKIVAEQKSLWIEDQLRKLNRM